MQSLLLLVDIFSAGIRRQLYNYPKDTMSVQYFSRGDPNPTANFGPTSDT